MKKNRKRAVSIALSLVLAMTAVNITGCGKKADSTNGELNLFIWTEYVPDEVIKDFEKEYGINLYYFCRHEFHHNLLWQLCCRL